MKADNITDIYDLSPLQQGLLFHSLYEPTTGVYVDQHSIRLQGPLQLNTFQQAWQQAMDRHGVLRTSFHWQKLKQPVQVVHRQLPLPWHQEDWTEIQPAAQPQALQEWLEQDRVQGFDLGHAPLFRISVLQRAPQDFQVVFSRHHILMDGWSRMLLYQEIFTIYQALIHHQSPVLSDAPAFRSYIRWIRQQDSAQDYWQTHLQGITAPTRIPGDAEQKTTVQFQSLQHCLSTDHTHKLQAFVRQHHLTLNTLVLAAWSILLSRMSGEADVIFGVTSSGRPPQLAQAEQIIGPLINTLPLRVKVLGCQSVIEWLQTFQASQVEMRQYEYCALTEIQAWSEVPPGLPLFESLAIFENYPVDASLGTANDELQILDTETISYTHYPLTLYASGGPQLKLDLGYRCDRYSESQVQQYLHILQTLITQMMVDTNRPLYHLTGLSESAANPILHQWNQTRQDYPKDCIHHLFERQVVKTPDAIALRDLSQSLTYTDLNEMANRLSHYLQRVGLGPEVKIGLALERSTDLVVAMLAVLKAGGAYIPLDPAYPPSRLAFMLEDSQAELLLTSSHLKSSFTAFTGTFLYLDEIAPDIARQPSHNPAVKTAPLNLAYIIYTSGSTGQPKGVAISHQSVVNFLCSHQQSPGLIAEDVLLAVTSLSFDIAVLELLLPLTVGAQVLVAPAAVIQDGSQLASLMEQATVMQATPATWRLLLAAGWAGQPHLKILCGGEALTVDLAERLLTKGSSLWNLYGPTETTIWSTQRQIQTGEVDIGGAIANTELYLLDPFFQPVPLGAPGELYIGGEGLARGYFNRPGLTAERFIPNPFSHQAGARLYRTGDLARYQPDGSLQHLGRLDTQVKVRGFRIELGEVEALLNRQPTIEQAVVGIPQDGQLIAYCQPQAGQKLSVEKLRTALQQQLPAHMIPSRFVAIASMPLTPNGKIDRRSLPQPDQAAPLRTTPFLPPQTDLEKQVADRWATLLKVERVGLQDNFFELGGHSILIVQLLTQMQEAFGIMIPLRSLFARPTLEAQVELVRAAQAGTDLAALDAKPDLHQEAVLDSALFPPTNWHEEPLQTLLLTGATGFLGGYLLAELLDKTSAQIYCLVRAENEAQGAAKLKANLESYGLWDRESGKRIIPVLGDLAKPRLGLSSEQFQSLSTQVQVIYHNGAWVNFLADYQTLKAANVLGTQEVLRLACTIRTKPVHLVSTFSVFSVGDRKHKSILLETDVPRHGDQLQSGYAQSKWVAEQLACQARERGLPVAIYRPGRVTGHSQTGQGNTGDFITSFVKGCIQLGSIFTSPTDPLMDFTPVDYVSQALVHISLQPDALGQIFHLVNPAPMSVAHLQQWLISDSGYDLQTLTYEIWHQQLHQATKETKTNALYPFMARFPSTIQAHNAPELASQFCSSHTLAALTNSAIHCPPVDATLLNTYFQFFIDSGFLPAPHSSSTIPD
ncbi:non-ribosomal peptide synthetase [Acaryochloris sp. IP29b_bin.148]|uniref:amino acid adenylation domain-containing protein n=1 Tax=Acaryochloris sp. IP29b_bin.148 TaxID=2969218 RepID=UPI00262D87EC|nr:non-ribosomal peptide synthetase [Acaryochloris sp. IP29b_bin.148]